MKNKSIYLLCLFISIALFSCNRPPKNFSEAMTDNFQGHKGFYQVRVPPSLLFKLIKAEQADEELAAMKDLKQIGVMSIGSTDISEMQEIEQVVNKWLNHFSYTDLLAISEGGRKIVFKLLEKESVVEEMLALIVQKENLLVISLHGRLDLNQVMALTKNLNPEVFRGLLQGNIPKE